MNAALVIIILFAAFALGIGPLCAARQEAELRAVGSRAAAASARSSLSS